MDELGINFVLDIDHPYKGHLHVRAIPIEQAKAAILSKYISKDQLREALKDRAPELSTKEALDIFATGTKGEIETHGFSVGWNKAMDEITKLLENK